MSDPTALSGPELARLLRKAHSSDPWYGSPTTDLLSALTPSSAASHPQANAHSAWEIVLHMTAWQREVARRLGGRPPHPPEAGDWPRPPAPTEDAWEAAQAELGSSLESLAQAVAGLSDQDLREPVGTMRDRALGSGVSRAEMIVGVLQHNAYHSGQIALLAKALSGR